MTPPPDDPIPFDRPVALAEFVRGRAAGEIGALVTALLRSPTRLVEITWTRAKTKPGRLTLWGDCTLDTAGGVVSRPMMARWGRSLPSPGATAIDDSAAIDSAAIDSAAIDSAAIDSAGSSVGEWQRRDDLFTALVASRTGGGHTTVVHISPFDPSVPELGALLDPVAMAGALGTVPVAVQTLRYRPGQRHVLAYRPTAEPVGVDPARRSPSTGERAWYAKVASDAEHAEAIVARQRTLAELTRTSRWQMVAPTQRLGRAVIYPAAPGSRVDPFRSAAVEQVAQALGEMHARPLDASLLALELPRHSPGAEWAIARRASGWLVGCQPSGRDRLGELVELIDAQVAALAALAVLAAPSPSGPRGADPPVPPVALLHGDLKLDHLFVSLDEPMSDTSVDHATGAPAAPTNSRLLPNTSNPSNPSNPSTPPVALIDLDRIGLGDPALDLGNLIADTVWQAPSAVAALAPRLLAASADPDGTLRRRVATIEAVALLRIAGRRLSLLDPDLRHSVAAALELVGDAVERAR